MVFVFYSMLGVIERGSWTFDGMRDLGVPLRVRPKRRGDQRGHGERFALFISRSRLERGETCTIFETY